MTRAELDRKRAGIRTSAPQQAAPIVSTGGPFRTLGEQMHAVRMAALSYGAPDERLFEVQKRAAGNPIGGSELVPSDGGFLVQPEFSRQILKRVYQTGEIFKRCLEIPVETNGFKFPQFDESSRTAGNRLGGIEGYWENEAANLKPAQLQGGSFSMKPSFNVSEVIPGKLTGFLNLTSELAQDSNAFAMWAEYAFSQELMFKLEGAIINGSGTGQPLGILNSPALALIAPQAGQGTHTVVSQNISTMLASLWAPSYNSAGTVFLYNQQLLPQLAALQTIVGAAGSQSNLWQWCKSDNDYDRLAGFPALSCEHCAVPGTSGDLLLCDFSRYLVVMRERMRAEVSIHLLFLTDQQAFRFVMRVGGQPIDRSPILPLNGNVATTPFVGLVGR